MRNIEIFASECVSKQFKISSTAASNLVVNPNAAFTEGVGPEVLIIAQIIMDVIMEIVEKCREKNNEKIAAAFLNPTLLNIVKTARMVAEKLKEAGVQLKILDFILLCLDILESLENSTTGFALKMIEEVKSPQYDVL